MWRLDERSDVERDGFELWRRGQATGPVVIVLPGLLGQFEPLESLCASLGRAHSLVGVAYAGLYGAPSAPSHAQDPEHMLARLVALAAEISGPIVWLGWSCGGRLAVEAAARTPASSVGAICVSGTFGRPFEQRLTTLIKPGSTLFRTLSEMQRGLRPGTKAPRWSLELLRASQTGWWSRALGLSAETISPDQVNELLAHSLGNDLHALVGLWRAMSRRCETEWVTALDCPSLFIHGERDLLTSVRDCRVAAAGPHAELTVVPGAGHLLPMAQRELLELRVSRFVRQLPAAIERTNRQAR